MSELQGQHALVTGGTRAIRGGEVGGNEVAGAVVVAAGPGGDNDPRAGAVEVPGDRGADAACAAGN